ncbi:MAG: lipoate--protein ligase [Prevotella sp.]|nr:lipoate--protein ligase [Prevotella sp.]
MTYVELPDDRRRRLSFYLAMEEYVARKMDSRDWFFMWRVPPTVIFGRNQVVENEVNIEYCRRLGIEMYRRKSGGGCVYSDMNNVMFSYVTADGNVNMTFNRYMNIICLMLMRMGIDATSSGRNDILIDGRKVSGNAFYRCAGRSIVHGTMLFDTDMDNMTAAITPTREKLESKGVDSVRSRIALLKDYTGMTIDEFMLHARTSMCSDCVVLTEEQVAEIEEIELEYISEKFIYGNNPRATKIIRKHIDGVGNFEIRLETKGGVIKDINILGDYFLLGDIEGEVLKPLRGISYNSESIEHALSKMSGEVIKGLDKMSLIGLLVEDNPSLCNT